MRHPGIGSVTPTLWAGSPDHWTTREIQHACCFLSSKVCIHCHAETHRFIGTQKLKRVTVLKWIQDHPFKRENQRWGRRHGQASSPSLRAQMGVHRVLASTHTSLLCSLSVMRLMIACLPNVFKVLFHRPLKFRAFLLTTMPPATKKPDQLSKADKELIIWVISLANRCSHIVVVHSAQ